jgi:hypothetical protein
MDNPLLLKVGDKPAIDKKTSDDLTLTLKLKKS